MGRTLVKNAEYIVTVDSGDRVLTDSSIAIEDGIIVGIGAADELERGQSGPPFDRVIDASGRLVMPGLVDAHLHLSEQLSRSLFPDCLNTRAWVFNWGKPFYAAVTEEDEYVSALFASVEMIRTGTTCFLEMGAQNDPGHVVRALDEVGIRGITGRHAADVRPDVLPEHWTKEMLDKHFFQSAEEALAALRACIERWNGAAGGRVRCWANIEGKEPCSAELHAGSRRLAEELGVGTTYHIASSLEEAKTSERKHGVWPVTRLARMDALGSNLVLAHVVALADHEIELLAESNTNVAFCPGTSLKVAKGATGIGRYPELLDAGVCVALGCDGTSAAGSLDMMRQLYLVAGLFKDARLDPTLIPASQAIRMATIDGAKALLWDDEIGSIELGKRADMIMFDLDDTEWTPCHDPIQALVYSATPRSLDMVLIDGHVVFEAGRVTTVDEAALRSEARARAADIVERSGLRRGVTPVASTAYD